MTESLAPLPGIDTPQSELRISRRLKLYFAILSCLGGLLMGIGERTTGLAVIAVFFAIFGYICVDRMRLFSLPSILAYTAMAMAGLYCVSDFADIGNPGSRQIEAVAELLVVVQGVLMLQTKSQRVYEQIAIFCLLQMIVAAVFNDAIQYGVMLLPIGLVGAWALSLLASLHAVRTGDDSVAIDQAISPQAARSNQENQSPADAQFADIRSWSPDSQAALRRAARRVGRMTSLTIAPAVILISTIFFYALPRTTDASRMGAGGKTLVGFNKQISLGKIGEMLQSSEQALRVYLSDRRTGQSYQAIGQLYLRGHVVERYIVGPQGEGSESACWTQANTGAFKMQTSLPMEYFPARSSDSNFFDSVDVNIHCESMKADSLFAIAPYFQSAPRNTIKHDLARWSLLREKKVSLLGNVSQPRIEYRFGTNAFRGNVQSDLISRWSMGGPWMRTHPELLTNQFSSDALADATAADALATDDPQSESQRFAQRQARMRVEDDAEKYVDACLEFDPLELPSAARLAKIHYDALPADRQNPYDFASSLERYLNSTGGFTYSLNLNATPQAGMDPIEQFLAIDRKGHCQYFASAMVMMLRSQGIPARLVVGYCTDEYNEIGGHYVARQLHAHAWVEALISASDLPSGLNVYGQLPSDQYWLRLDPTPGGGGGGETLQQTAGVGQVIDIARNIWKDYVVDMDGNRQDSALLASAGDTPMSDAYGRMITRIQTAMARIRAGELGGGSLAGRDVFSWSGAVLGIGIAALGVVLMRLRLPGWLGRRRTTGQAGKAQRPAIDFYAEAVEMLERIGIFRQRSQTPAELHAETNRRFETRQPSPADPLAKLTGLYYAVRFGRTDPDQVSASKPLGELGRCVDQLEGKKQS